jgi:excinuclease ABC subunit B
LGIFNLNCPWPPAGDQPQAIEALTQGLSEGLPMQTLIGVTGSGKTYTVANVISRFDRPVLVLAHNKTLAAQLYTEFKTFFPENEVHYFVSYYDYYQPEAYVPAHDLYIEKDASINERIEKLRLATTKALIERRDVIVVASVSCIYGLGKKKDYEEAVFGFKVGEQWKRRDFFESLLANYYQRNDTVLEPAKFRVKGDVVEVYPAYSDTALRIFFDDRSIERIDEIEPLSGKMLRKKDQALIFPAQHYVTTRENIARALSAIESELEEQLALMTAEGRLVEAQRLRERTRYDMEMLAQVGYCSGIENYSRHLEGREPGEPPGTLLDFFPPDFIMVIDESHITIPQIRGMYNGDRSRKETLVRYGFRLPSSLDNRPLKWEEFRTYMKQVIFVSATPGDWEMNHSSRVVEQLIRPTGVVDPEVIVVEAKNQVDDLIGRLSALDRSRERALVTTLTKRSAEDLAEYLSEAGLKVRYIHSELDTFERADLLKHLRLGEIQVLVGVNLLREGLDLPEVSLVAILDADREGFLRSHRSLIQMIGRAARNISGSVVLYADTMNESIRKAVEETRRRREAQQAYNESRGIVPRTILKEVVGILPGGMEIEGESPSGSEAMLSTDRTVLEEKMWKAVERLDFEEAARIRDLLASGGEGVLEGGSSHRRAGSKRAQSEKHFRRTSKR